MGIVYGIKFKVNTKEDKEKFQLAFNDIFLLASAFLDCVKEESEEEDRGAIDWYLRDISDEEFIWLELSKKRKKIGRRYVCFYSEGGPHYINENDLEEFSDTNPIKIKYDLQKSYPAPPDFLIAILDILYHYMPNAELLEDYEVEDAQSALALVRLINPDIKDACYSEDILGEIPKNELWDEIAEALPRKKKELEGMKKPFEIARRKRKKKSSTHGLFFDSGHTKKITKNKRKRIEKEKSSFVNHSKV